MDIWDGVKKVLKSTAPVLANAIVPGSGGLAAELLGNVFGVDKNDPVAIEEAIRNASPEQKAAMLQEQNRHKERLQEIAAELELAHRKEDSNQIESINATMRVEASQHKWSGMWRPFWGFISGAAFGVFIFGVMIIMAIIVWKGQWKALQHLPSVIMAIAALFGIPCSILGVASYHRGKMQRIQAGEHTGPGLAQSIIGAISNRK